MPEPLYDERYQSEPWFWHPDIQDGIPWAAVDLLRGTHRFHVVTDTFHYATREAAIADLERAFEAVETRVTATHPCR